MNRNLVPSFLMVVLMMSSGCATRGPTQGGHPAPDHPGDPGYFLTLSQKGQLIGHGRVQDSGGGWYNIWICPGYSEPIRDAGQGLRKTGEALGTYAESGHYQSLVDRSGNALEWAFSDCLMDFTLEGTPRAWKRYVGRANERVEQRVFGWWMAHPWALLQSGVDTVVRIPVGLTGTVLGASWGGIVVPAWYAVSPVGKAAWYGSVDTVILPGVAGAWNTVASPPLALVGQKPAPSRVDGFWVRYISENELAARAERERRLTDQEKTAAATLAATARDTYRSFDARFVQHRATFDQRQEALQEERTAATHELEQELVDALQLSLSGQSVSPGSRLEQEIRDQLIHQGGMHSRDADRLIRLLRQSTHAPQPNEGGFQSTDPARESIRVIEQLDP